MVALQQHPTQLIDLFFIVPSVLEDDSAASLLPLASSVLASDALEICPFSAFPVDCNHRDGFTDEKSTSLTKIRWKDDIFTRNGGCLLSPADEIVNDFSQI